MILKFRMSEPALGRLAYACVPSDLRSHSADRPRGRSKRAPPMPREWASIAQLDGELKERAMGFL